MHTGGGGWWEFTQVVGVGGNSQSVLTFVDVGAIEILDWLLCQPGCKELVNYQDTAGYTPSHDAVEAE